MKKLLALLMTAVILLSAASCGAKTDTVNLIPDEILSPVAIYSMAENIVQQPANYVGKAFQAEGQTCQLETSSTGYFIRISDSTACCFVDLEFKLAEGLNYPEDASFIQLFGTIASYQAADGSTVVRFDADKILYEEELRELYGEE